jgi:multiple sugar transport system substrate-binding protein
MMLLVLSLMIIPMLAGCSTAGDSGKTTITMAAWGNPSELKGYRKAIDAFEKKNPDIKVNLVPISIDVYEQKIMTQMTGGNAPDVFYAHEALMSKLVESKSAAPLSKRLNGKDSAVKPDQFAQGLWGPAKQGDEIYGVMVDANPMLIYYNKKVFEEAGVKNPQEYYDEGKWNWDTFQKISAQFKSKGKYGFVQENWGGPMLTWISSNGGKMYDENGKIILDKDKKAAETLQYLSDNVKKKNFIYAGSLPEGQGLEAMFMSGKVAMVGAGRWLTPLFKDNPSVQFDYIPWPTNTGKKTEPAVIGTAYMVMNKQSKHADAAFKFLSYYTSEESQKLRLEHSGNAIPSIDGIDEVVTKDGVPEHAEYLLKARETGFTSEPQARVPAVNKLAEESFDLLFLGKSSPEKTIETLTKKGNQLIAKHQAKK